MSRNQELSRAILLCTVLHYRTPSSDSVPVTARAAIFRVTDDVILDH